MHEWPAWWEYEVVLSPHAIERMQDRDLSEADLRAMLEDAAAHRHAVLPGRFVITTNLAGTPWEVVVEPDHPRRGLIIVTAYRVE